jgi:uncharacterized membrane protein
MSSARLPRSIFFGVTLAALARCIYFYPLLPERMASHFDISGVPNGWMAKPVFFGIYAGVWALSSVVLFVPSRTIAGMPASRINLPNKEYWLAPERRPATIAYFERSFAWFGCAVLVLVVLALDLAMQANLVTPVHLAAGTMLVYLAVFLAFTIAWVVSLVRHFSTLDSAT